MSLYFHYMFCGTFDKLLSMICARVSQINPIHDWTFSNFLVVSRVCKLQVCASYVFQFLKSKASDDIFDFITKLLCSKLALFGCWICCTGCRLLFLCLSRQLLDIHFNADKTWQSLECYNLLMRSNSTDYLGTFFLLSGWLWVWHFFFSRCMCKRNETAWIYRIVDGHWMFKYQY